MLEVGPDDEYLRHVLRVHGADILRFQPDFVLGPGRRARPRVPRAQGDETVGVVLLRADGDVARVQLDYVTPRYRDFSPGEFVWRRSGLLRDPASAGWSPRRAWSAPYYDRLGFRREGESYVLDALSSGSAGGRGDPAVERRPARRRSRSPRAARSSPAASALVHRRVRARRTPRARRRR